MSPTPGSLLIHVPVPLHRAADGDGWLLEDQACNGLRLWARHFERLIVTIPVATGPVPPSWVPIAAVGPDLARIDLVPVPEAWRADRFLRALPGTRRRLRQAIADADRLSFAIGGLFGDWGAVGALIARRMGRPYAIWTDRVESQVTRSLATTAPRWRTRLRARLTWRPMAGLERYLIRHAALGLFHGRETWAAYAPLCRQPELVHDIHLGPAAHIAPAALAQKRAGIGTRPLRLIYAGRAEPMKGPHDWLATLEQLHAAGVDFTACWLGDGDQLAAMRDRVAGGPLAGRVTLPGFLRDRTALARELQGADGLLFCHLTPESPRILIEALAAGTPLLGYHGAFAADLLTGHDSGILTTPGDPAALARAVANLAADPARLGRLMQGAAAAGAQFHSDAVFAHRAALITRYLPGPQPG